MRNFTDSVGYCSDETPLGGLLIGLLVVGAGALGLWLS